MLTLYVPPAERLVVVGPRGQRLEFGRAELPAARGDHTPIRDGSGLVGWIERCPGGRGRMGVTVATGWHVFTSDRPWARGGGGACSA